MAITPLPTPPLRSDPTNFAARGDAFLGALPQFQVEANALAAAMNLNSTTDSSTSSITIGTGAKTFVVSSGKSFQPGMYLVIADVAAPSANSMFGQITSYSDTSLVMSITSVRGSGTIASWIISQSSAGGAQAGPLASSGITGAAASGANTDITSITGNAATATAAKSGYFTVAHATTPKLEINKSGVLAGMWTINSTGKFSLTTTDGTGVAFNELLTISPSGVLSSAGGFDGNAATATTAGNTSNNNFVTAGFGAVGTENTLGAKCSGYNPAYLYNNAGAWGLYSISGGSIIEYNRGSGKIQMHGIAASANNLNGTNHNVQGSKVAYTNYSNSSGKIMIVTIGLGNTNNQMATLFVNSSPVCSANLAGSLTAVVPDGSYYSLGASTGTNTWGEYY